MNQSSDFFVGFEKRAESDSLIGVMPNIQPGIKKFKKGGVINNQQPVRPGATIAPRSDKPELATFADIPAKKNMQASIPPKPKDIAGF